MKVIILGGAGDMGSRAVRELAQDPEVERLTIADANLQAAERLAGSLGGAPVDVARVDARDHDALRATVSGYDVAASAIGPFYLFEELVASAVVDAGVPYVSICDDYDGTQAVLGLDARARQAGVAVLTGLGWTPGISNVLARKAADALEEVEEVNVSWAGSASDSEGFAVILHTIHIFTGQVPSYRDGRELRVRAGSGRERVRFPEPVGQVDVYHVGHPEPVTIPRFMPGVRTVTLKGGLSEAPLNRLAIALARARLTDTPEKKERLGRLIERALPVLSRLGKPAQPCSAIRVDVRGRAGGEARTVSYGAAGHMAALTGVPLAIGAKMLAAGEIEARGVVAPEACVPPDRFLAELGRRGIPVYEMGVDRAVNAEGVPVHDLARASG